MRIHQIPTRIHIKHHYFSVLAQIHATIYHRHARGALGANCRFSAVLPLIREKGAMWV